MTTSKIDALLNELRRATTTPLPPETTDSAIRELRELIRYLPDHHPLRVSVLDAIEAVDMLVQVERRSRRH